MGDGIEIGFSLLIRDHGVCREPVVGEELRPAVGQQPVGRKKARVVAQPPEGSMDTTVETVAIVEDMGDVDGTQSDLPAVEVDKGLELVGPQFGSHQWRLPRGETGAQPVIGSLPAEVGGWQPADVGIDHMSCLSHQFETKGDYGIQFFVTVHLGLAGRKACGSAGCAASGASGVVGAASASGVVGSEVAEGPLRGMTYWSIILLRRCHTRSVVMTEKRWW